MDDLDLGATIKGFKAGQKVFNRYTLKKILGRGGMGVVWLAHDEELSREVALKFLPEAVTTDRGAIADLKRETRRALELTHPHIVRIHDFVSDAHTAGISMEFVAGDTLSGLRADQPGGHFEVPDLTEWVKQLCEALDYAHARAKVIHRDLKPANLMVDARGELKVADFGISSSVADSVSRVSKVVGGTSGTPVYMSPQQMLGETPAPTDDIYSLGATLYELLTGRPPFHSGRIETQVMQKVPPSLAQRREELEVDGLAIPLAWERTIAACLAKEPQERPQSAGEVAERLGLARGSSGVAAPSPRSGRAKHGASPRQADPAQADPVAATRSETKSRAPRYALLAAGALLLAGLGYYFGVHAPKQERLAEIARLAAARGGLIVRTTPDGAEVRVGAIALEKAPLTLRELKAGRYPVRVRLAGYEDWDGEATVKENEFAELNVPLVRSTGSAQISSVPAGLAFTLTSGAITTRGTTPARVEKLPTGTYFLAIAREGWPEQKRTLFIERGRTAEAVAEFPSGRLVITSTPAGAEVVSGGQVVGVTPYTLPEAFPGAWSAELRLRGYRPQTVSGTVVAQEELRLSATLKAFLYTEGERETIPGLDLAMVPIAPGTFLMGSERGGGSDERPVTRVTLTRPFWLGATEVTQGQWESVMGNNPSHFKGDALPVERVSWTEAMEFCRKLTERERAAGRLPEGYVYTLPTEAQWEYACRAGTTGDYAGELNAMGWYDQNSGSKTHPVGQKQANAWGLYDMHGNVWEWCLDWYADKLPGGSVTDPTGATSGSARVFRGGSWGSTASICRSAIRNWYDPGLRNYGLGFRLALSSVP